MPPHRRHRTIAAVRLACLGLAALAVSPAGVAFQTAWVQAVVDTHIAPDARPTADSAAAGARISAAPGEYQPLSFVVHADTDIRALQVTAGPVVDLQGEPLADAVLDARIVKRWYQSSFGAKADKNLRFLRSELLLYDDALVRVEDGENYVRLTDGSYLHVSAPAQRNRRVVTPVADMPIADAAELQPVDIAAGSNRQFWVTLHTPVDAKPGTYTAAIRLEDARGRVETLLLEIELLPIVLRDPDIEISIYYRGVLDASMPDGSISSESKSEAQYLADLRNMAAHGVSSPTIYQKYPTGQLDRVLQLWKQAGLMPPRRLYYLGLTVVPNNQGRIPETLARDVRAIRARAARYGIDEVYFYARDEARGEALTYQLPFWNEVRRVGGRIMAAGWQSDAIRDGNFDVTGGEEDLFVSLGTARRSESARWHSRDRLIYSYQNPTGGYELPETYRRNYGLLLWQMDYDGSMPYAYQDSEGRAWHDFDSSRNRELSFTYPTISGPVDTVQWEGFREGVDDLRYLATLKALIRQHSGAQADEARRWLEELKDSVLAQQDLDQIRAGMVARILWLQDSPVAETGIRQGSLQFGAVDPTGNLTIRWKTSQRALQVLWLDDGSGIWQPVSGSGGITREHAVHLQGLVPEREYRVRITPMDAMDAQDPLAEGSFTTRRDFSVATASATRMASSVSLDVRLVSDHDSSVVLDWNDSLLGWWRFSEARNGQVEDASGNNRTARLRGVAEIGAGRFGQGVELDGNGAFVSIPDISFPENGSGTIEGWFRFDTFAMDERVNIGVFPGLYQHASSNHLYITRTNDYFLAADRLHTGQWHHLALTWNGNAATAMLYVDGHPLEAVILGEAENVPAINGMAVGRSTGYLAGLIRPVPGSLAGAVDEIRVWNRPLQAAEIRAAWSAGPDPELNFTLDVSDVRRASWRVLGANAADQLIVTPREVLRAD